MAEDQQWPRAPRAAEEPFAGTRPITDRAPFTITVLDLPTAEDVVQTETPVEVEVPQGVNQQRHAYVMLTLGVAAVLLVILYQIQFAPLVLRFKHGLQRRIYGERTYEARPPKAAGPVIGPH